MEIGEVPDLGLLANKHPYPYPICTCIPRDQQQKKPSQELFSVTECDICINFDTNEYPNIFVEKEVIRI